MARIDNLTNFLTDIATAIRTKKETEAEIPAEQFDSEILTINTVNNQDKEITENGTYSPDEGYTGLGNVVVNVPTGGSGDVKLFETEEEMKTDKVSKEGDLAVVYKGNIQNMTSDMQVQTITFPQIVTLPEAFASDAYCMLRAVSESSGYFDGDIMLSSSSFTFNVFSETGNIRVQYTSEDGIIYTRTDNGDKTIDCGVVIGVYSSEEWNDNFGYFMQIDSFEFDGLYEFGPYTDESNYMIVNNCEAEKTETYWKGSYDILNDELSETNYEKIDTIIKELVSSSTSLTLQHYLLEKIDDNVYYAYMHASSSNLYKCSFVQLTENENTQYPLYIGAYIGLKGSTTQPIYIYKVDLSTNTGILLDTITSLSTTQDKNGNTTEYIESQTIDSTRKFVFNNDISINVTGNDMIKQEIICNMKYPTKYKYQIAPNQFTLTEPNQLLPGVVAFGKTETITGDGSIYNNLDWSKIAGLQQKEDSSPIMLDDIRNISDSHTISYLRGITISPHTIRKLIRDESSDKYIGETSSIQRQDAVQVKFINGNDYLSIGYDGLSVIDMTTKTHTLYTLVNDLSHSNLAISACMSNDKRYILVFAATSTGGTTYTLTKIDLLDYSSVSITKSYISNVLPTMLGYDSTTETLYFTNAKWATSSGNIYKMTSNGTVSSVLSLSYYSYSYILPILTKDYIGVAILANDNQHTKKIYYLAIGDSTFQSLDVTWEGNSLSGAYNVGNKLYLSINDKRFYEVDLSTKVTTEINDRYIDYQKILFEDDTTIYHAYGKADKTGKVTLYDTTFTVSNYSKTNLICLNDPNTQFITMYTLYPVRLDNIFSTDEGMIVENITSISSYGVTSSTNIRLNDFDYSIISGNSSSPISQEEYNTAVSTSQDILGGE